MRNTKLHYGQGEVTKYLNKRLPNPRIYKLLQCFREDQIFCDIKLETDDGTVIFGHKMVLGMASPYFYEIFTNFSENNQDHVIIKDLDSSALQQLVDFFYTGKITITGKNVQVLYSASELLQLKIINDACHDFLQEQYCPID